MSLGFLTESLRVPTKKFLAVTLLISGTLAWFFLLNFKINDIYSGVTGNEALWSYYNLGRILFYGTSIFSALFASLFARKINRFNLLAACILLGIFATVSLTLFQGTPLLIVSSVLLGVSLGLGLPSSMASMAECTVVEERARVSGAIILATFILAFATMAIISILQFSVTTYILVFAAVRAVSLIALGIDRCDGKEDRESGRIRLPSVAKKEFLFYLTPWLMFCIAGSLAWNLIPTTGAYESAVNLGTGLRYVSIAVSGLLSGFIADRVGRKQPIIVGLILLGVSFALLGFAMSQLAVVFYLAVSGIAWGFFFVIYLALPGDLSVKGSREKFYGMLYIMPVAALFAFGAIPGLTLFSNDPAAAAPFSQILSVILFAAIIPVWRAKETLSSKKVEERKMQEHVKKIRKIVEEQSEG